jgi:hypothetical protein
MLPCRGVVYGRGSHLPGESVWSEALGSLDGNGVVAAPPGRPFLLTSADEVFAADPDAELVSKEEYSDLKIRFVQDRAFGELQGELAVRCDAGKHLHVVPFIVDGRVEGAEVLQLLQGQADLFAHFPPDRGLGALSSGDAAARKRPLFAPVRVAHQEPGAPLLNRALDAEGLRSHAKPMALEQQIEHLDEPSLAQGTSAASPASPATAQRS